MHVITFFIFARINSNVIKILNLINLHEKQNDMRFFFNWVYTLKMRKYPPMGWGAEDKFPFDLSLFLQIFFLF